ncbi:hypothetical protein [Egbenema bharatensis]|uniref:hypothetical protein n=1 Tax=Egbenema bharatensis TaxID=3463334 RepID=UPI003A874C60
MRELQQEKKAIESQLKSIRAASSQRHRAPVLEPFSTKPPTPDPGRTTQMNPTHPILSESSRSVRTQPTSSNSVHFPSSFTADSCAPTTHSSLQPQTNSRQSSRQSSQSQSSVRPYPTQGTQNFAEPKRSDGLPPRQQTRSAPDPRPVPDELAATVRRLQQQSEFYVQQFNRLQSPTLQTPQEVLNQAFRILDAHVQHINQLSEIQESALLELKAMAAKVEQDWAALERTAYYKNPIESDTEPPVVCEYEKTAVPQIAKNSDGIYVLQARSIDLFQAEREANLTAQALRHWGNRSQDSGASSRGVWAWFSDLFMPAESDPHTASASAPRSPQPPSPQTALRSPVPGTSPPYHHSPSRARSRARRTARRSVSLLGFDLREGAALFVGAVLGRIALNFIISAFPFLWTPAVALLAAPAMIAVYRTSRTPRSGMSWIYRLLILMLGLLIGGRL